MSHTTDVSEGAVVDGSDDYVLFDNPTPGRSNTETIVINEVMAHSHSTLPDWIELYNSSYEVIDIGGWYLSDDRGDLKKFEIPAGTVLNPDDYVVFYENVHFGEAVIANGFALSEGGQTLYLTGARDGQLTGYRTWEDFGASATGVTIGRYQKSTGAYNFVSLSDESAGFDNAAPLTGPVVISEIMYNPGSAPGDDELEYIELHNVTGTVAFLISLVDTENTPGVSTEEYLPWMMTDGIEFTFPGDIMLNNNERILLVKNKAAFHEHYTSVPPGTRIFEWTTGSLSNDGERLQFSLPGDKEYGKDRFWIRIDRVNYADQGRWPFQADGDGMSLDRIDDAAYGNDPANWQATSPTPGY